MGLKPQGAFYPNDGARTNHALAFAGELLRARRLRAHNVGVFPTRHGRRRGRRTDGRKHAGAAVGSHDVNGRLRLLKNPLFKRPSRFGPLFIEASRSRHRLRTGVAVGKRIVVLVSPAFSCRLIRHDRRQTSMSIGPGITTGRAANRRHHRQHTETLDDRRGARHRRGKRRAAPDCPNVPHDRSFAQKDATPASVVGKHLGFITFRQ